MVIHKSWEKSWITSRKCQEKLQRWGESATSLCEIPISKFSESFTEFVNSLLVNIKFGGELWVYPSHPELDPHTLIGDQSWTSWKWLKPEVTLLQFQNLN